MTVQRGSMPGTVQLPITDGDQYALDNIPTGAVLTRDGYVTVNSASLVTQASASTTVAIWQSNDNRIYADAGQAVPDPGNAPTGSVSGWYWDNPATEKVNWYEDDINVPFGSIEGYSAWVRYDEVGSLAFLALYTMPLNDGKDRASWYRSRVILLIESAGNVSPFEDTIATWRSDPSDAPASLQRLAMNVDPTTTLLSTGSSTLTDIAGETLCLAAFSTSSGRPAGADKLLLRNWWMQASGVVYRRDMVALEPQPIVIPP